MAAMSMALVFTGCGDDDDDDDNGGPNPPQQFAPADIAALTAQNKIYTINIPGQGPLTLRFPAAGQYEIAETGAATETGAFSGETKTDNAWTLTLTPTAGQQGARDGVLRLDFTAANAGSWTFTPTGGQAETGTFSVTDDPGSTTGNPTTGNTTGNPPVGVEGKTLQITYVNGGGEKFQFTSATSVSYENGLHTGTYTYDETNDRINVILADNGWTYDITLNDGTNATVFFKQNPEDSGTTDQATYTLL